MDGETSLRLFAGCGVVAGSTPADELAEALADRYDYPGCRSLSAEESRERVATDDFLEAFWDPRALTIHPLNFALGLARAARDAGVQIFENSRVLGYSTREPAEVKTAGGRVVADQIVLACNGYRVPLQGTGVHGECLAGVRYKVANPPATRHPTLAPVEALVFDLIDTWSGLAIGGCSYFPPRPELQGPVASAPPASTAAEASAPVLPPTPPVSVPPRSQAGRFLPQGSGLLHI